MNVPRKPKLPCDSATLWENLPYAGYYSESIYAGETYTKFETPKRKTNTLTGKPLPIINNGADKSLRLIGFVGETVSVPIRPEIQGRLLSFSPWLEYKVEWNVSEKCTIGFYTDNYLADNNAATVNRSILLISNCGPCLFTGTSGKYYTSFNSMYVITNKDVTVTLTVTCRAPKEISFLKLEPYVPVPYKTKCGCVYAAETRVTQLDTQVVFVPTSKYIDATNKILTYLVDTSVLLEFSPVVFKALKSVPGEFTLFNLSITGPVINNGEALFTVEFPNRANETEYSTIPGPDNKPRGLNIIPSVSRPNTNANIFFNINGVPKNWTISAFLENERSERIKFQLSSSSDGPELLKYLAESLSVPDSFKAICISVVTNTGDFSDLRPNVRVDILKIFYT